MKKNSRNLYLDIIKGVAIFLVVLGHCIQYGSGYNYKINEIYFNNIIFKFIYSFHMPLFMLVSGYLFYYSINKYTSKNLIKKKINNLIIPIISFSFIILVIKILINDINIEFNIYFIKDIIKNFLGCLWFLWAIFYCSLIILLVNRLFKDNPIIYLIIFIISFFIPDMLGFALYKYMYPFFVLGYFFNKNKMYMIYDRLNKKVIIFCLLFIFLILFSLYNYDSFIYTTGHYILKGKLLTQVLINLYRYIIGLFGSCFVLVLIREIYLKIPKKINIVIEKWGENSLGIYALSNLIFVYVLPNITLFVKDFNFILIFLETVIILVVVMILIKFIKKNSILRYLLLGNKLK